MEICIEQKISTDKKVAVLFGGLSSERSVSLRSGINCFQAIQRLGYHNAVLIDVNDNKLANKLIYNGIEVAYIALHGRYGEDGCVQGLLEFMKIPYTGCGVLASAVCMNKEYTKRLLGSQGIKLIKSVYFTKEENYLEKLKELKFPMMIKPASEGSSVGMSKVSNQNELEKALEEAFKYDKEILVEEFLTGVNATVGVLENEGQIFATPILEIRTKTEWYDYDAKYTEGLTDFILPAELSEEMTKEVQNIAIQSHKATKCSGVSRVDFLISDNVPYVLEINTSPGMTDLSDLPAQAKCMGIDYDTLVQIILNSASLNK